MSASEVELVETPLDNVPGIVDHARQEWLTHQLWSDKQKKEFTLRQLKSFKALIDDNKDKICEAIKEDLNKNEIEVLMMEVSGTLQDLIIFIRDFEDFTKPRPVKKTLLTLLDNVYSVPQPYGLVLIYGAWNYPFSLIAQPLIGAIAAGNAVIVKPSELSVRTSNLFATLIPKYLDTNYYKVITGGVEVAQAVLKERYNYIFYTGSTTVGRIVMTEAAKHLTPVTLELGGKSPAIVNDDANIKIAAKRIIWGKLANSGQTCIAPDYVLLTSPAIKDKFVEHCKTIIKSFFGEDPSKSKDYGRIVNRTHFDRLTGLMKTSKGNNILSGDNNRDNRYIAPAIFVDVQEDDSLMKQELFGPILPIIVVDGIDQAIQFVNKRERPLAFYVFTESKSSFDKVVNSTSSGALIQNNTLIYAGGPIPFGGIGNSGMGSYHGKYTFDTFSHMKPIYRSGTKTDFLQDVVYPPYTKSKIAQINFIQTPTMRRWSIMKPLALLFIVTVLAIATQVYGIPSWLYRF